MQIPVGLLSHTDIVNRQLGPFRPNEGYWLGNRFLFPQALPPAFVPPAQPAQPPQSPQQQPQTQPQQQPTGLLGYMPGQGDGGAGNGFGDREQDMGGRTPAGFSEGLSTNQPGSYSEYGDIAAPGPNAAAVAATLGTNIGGIPSISGMLSDDPFNETGPAAGMGRAPPGGMPGQSAPQSRSTPANETKTPAEEAGFGTTGKTGWGRPDVTAFSQPTFSTPSTPSTPTTPQISQQQLDIHQSLTPEQKEQAKERADMMARGIMGLLGFQPTISPTVAAATATSANNETTSEVGPGGLAAGSSKESKDYGGGTDGGFGGGQTGPGGLAPGHDKESKDYGGGTDGGADSGGNDGVGDAGIGPDPGPGDRRKGGPTGDDRDGKLEKVPIMAHEGEYVHRPEAVKHYGVAFMKAINDRRIPKKAALGLLSMMKEKPKSRGILG